jgi:hypothetical protein
MEGSWTRPLVAKAQNVGSRTDGLPHDWNSLYSQWIGATDTRMIFEDLATFLLGDCTTHVFSIVPRSANPRGRQCFEWWLGQHVALLQIRFWFSVRQRSNHQVPNVHYFVHALSAYWIEHFLFTPADRSIDAQPCDLSHPTIQNWRLRGGFVRRLSLPVVCGAMAKSMWCMSQAHVSILSSLWCLPTATMCHSHCSTGAPSW